MTVSQLTRKGAGLELEHWQGRLVMRFNPLLSLVITIAYALRGRLHFPKNRIGEVLTMEDGQRFIIFRQVSADPSKYQAEEPGATFRVRLHVAHMSPRQNKLFSLLPIPFFVGLRLDLGLNSGCLTRQVVTFRGSMSGTQWNMLKTMPIPSP